MAEFQAIMKQAKRMCEAQNDCEECPIFEECDGSGYVSLDCTADAEVVERKIMDWAAKNPEPRYPSWNEWQGANFQMAERAICAAHFMDAGDAGCYASGNNCDKCRERPIPADVADKLGIKLVGGEEDD